MSGTSGGGQGGGSGGAWGVGTSGGGQGGGSGGAWGGSKKSNSTTTSTKKKTTTTTKSVSKSSSTGSKKTGGNSVKGKNAHPGIAQYKIGSDVQSILNKLKKQTQGKLDKSNPFGFMSNFTQNDNLYRRNAAEAGALEQTAANRAVDQGVRNQYMLDQQNLSGLRNLLARPGTSGSNRGAAAGSILQGVMQSQMNGANAQTELLQNAQSVAAKTNQALTAARIQALADTNKAKEQQGALATDKYTADAGVYGQLLAALGSMGGVLNTNRNNVGINNAANKTNASMVNAQNTWNFKTYG